MDAEPVVFGDNRRPDAALLPYETFELLLELAEDIVIAQRVREREAADSGNRPSLAEVAEELGVDLDELRPKATTPSTTTSSSSTRPSRTCGCSLNDLSHRLEVFRRLKRLDAGEESPQVLHDYAKTGDLRDRGKIVVAVDGEPEYRIVVRDLGGHFQVCEVVAVEDRERDFPYLLAGLRLGRITYPVRRSDILRRIWRIRNLRDP